MLSLVVRDDPLLPGTASPVFNIDKDPTLFSQPIPELPNGYHHDHKQLDPLKWLHDHSHIDPSKLPTGQLLSLQASRPKAALVSLVNNSDVAAMVHTISQVEAWFNSKKLHRYDWVFFSSEDFGDEFKAAVLNVSSSRCFFERIPEHHWAVPHWIDDARFSDAHQFLEGVGAEKTWSESHHHKSRWNAGLFALESRLQDYEWYWRIEPGVSSPVCHSNHHEHFFHPSSTLSCMDLSLLIPRHTPCCCFALPILHFLRAPVVGDEVYLVVGDVSYPYYLHHFNWLCCLLGSPYLGPSLHIRSKRPFHEFGLVP